jgi:hypothetical protein
MSERATHTPGPWRVSKDTQSVVSRDAYICRARMMRLGQGVANAYLIAAAPELLDALKDMLEGGLEGPTSQAIEAARAAIAKAEGRAA